MSRPAPTQEQLRAIEAAGNVLVMAGAGTGKTRTLVERCLAQVAHPERPVSLDAMLLVTFTEAAAAEMRQRLRAALEQLAHDNPDRAELAAQLARVETARISTLHGFCAQLVREHFHELELDPELTVLADDRARLLAEETLDDLLREQFEAATPGARVVHDLLLDMDQGGTATARNLVRRIHDYARSLADPEGWFDRQQATLESATPARWVTWLEEGFAAWREEWLPVLDAQPAANTKAHACAAALRSAGANPRRHELAAALERVAEEDADWPKKTLPKSRYRDHIERFFEEAAFLGSVARVDAESGFDPLDQDWRWSRGSLLALLGLAREFGRRFAQARRELGAVDFADLEQHALSLLWNRRESAPTGIARSWQERLQLVFVDEYQDINEVQDRILCALSRPGPRGNRFLVGDVKQSIYRFRLADPRIFQDYARRWREPGADGEVLALTGNFRSHPGILEFVNRVFAPLMREEVGGICYREDQFLRPGVPTPEPPGDAGTRSLPGEAPTDGENSVGMEPAVGDGDGPGILSAEACSLPVEVQLVRAPGRGGPGDDEEITNIEKEAWLLADRLHQLHHEHYPVVDRDGSVRSVRWGDMAVLLRAPGGRAEAYARMFQRRGVPFRVRRSGFFTSLEVTDLLSLMQLLDNPLQDLPLVAVLRSPLAGFSPDELGCVRLAQRQGPLWTALARLGAMTPELLAAVLPEQKETVVSAREKARRFLADFARWRQRVRVAPLSECLEEILDATDYEAWLESRDRGGEALAGVRRLLALTRQFDHFQRQGLPRFLQFVEARRELEIDLEPGVAESTDAVQMVSVHQAKGLEFAVVAVADVAHGFNTRDLTARILLDEYYGLCSQVQPPEIPTRYPSLPHWLAARRQRREMLGEELRLLYVALTRARQLLIISGIALAADADGRWAETQPGPGGFTGHQVAGGGSWLDWLGPWMSAATGCTRWEGSGAQELFRWRVVETADPCFEKAAPAAEAAAQAPPAWLADPAVTGSLQKVLAWEYPQAMSGRQPAKASVSQLRRQVQREGDEEAVRWLGAAPGRGDRARHGLAAAEVGSAHHQVLEAVPLDLPVTRQSLHNTITRLREDGALSEAETQVLDLDGMEAFWLSELGRAVQSKREWVHRELPFTARLTPADLTLLGVGEGDRLAPDDFVVVQGVADLVVLMPDALWLVDFKTDRVPPGEVEARVREHSLQLRLYALALGRIHGRPVTRCCLHFLALRRTVDVG